MENGSITLPGDSVPLAQLGVASVRLGPGLVQHGDEARSVKAGRVRGKNSSWLVDASQKRVSLCFQSKVEECRVCSWSSL